MKKAKTAEVKERRMLPIGDVFEPNRPRVSPADKPKLPFIGMEHVEAHTMKLLGTVPAGTMKSSSVHFQPGDVLYGRLRPYLNKVYRPDFEGLCSAEFIVFPNAPDIDTKYLQYFLNSYDFVSFATHLNEGDRPRVDFKQIAPYPFPLAPLPEQRRIVSAIETQLGRLDAAVARLHAAKAKLKRYKQAVLKAAFSGELIGLVADSNDGQGRWGIPTTWTWKEVQQVSEVSTGNTPPTKTPAYYGSFMPLIRPTELVDGELGEAPVMLSEAGAKVARRVPGGAVLVSCIGALGKTGLAVRELAFNQQLNAVVFGSEVLPRYGFYYAQTLEPWLASVASATTLPLVNKSKFLTAPIPVAPLHEQTEIIKRIEGLFEAASEMQSVVDAQLLQSTRLRQAVLKRAFEGRLV